MFLWVRNVCVLFFFVFSGLLHSRRMCKQCMSILINSKYEGISIWSMMLLWYVRVNVEKTIPWRSSPSPMTMKWPLLIEFERGPNLPLNEDQKHCNSVSRPRKSVLHRHGIHHLPLSSKLDPILPASGTKHFMHQVDFAPHQINVPEKMWLQLYQYHIIS